MNPALVYIDTRARYWVKNLIFRIESKMILKSLSLELQFEEKHKIAPNIY